MEATITQTYWRLWHEHWWWQVRREIVLREARAALERTAADQKVTERKGVAAHAGTAGGEGRFERSQEPTQPQLFEIGCGGGHSFEALSQLGSIRGVEPDPIMIGDDNPWREQIAVSMFGRDFPCDERFALVLALDVLEHIADDAGAVARVVELLAPGGRFLITVPALPCLWSLHDVAHHHFRRYTRRTLRALLQGANLRIEKMRYCFGWTLPMVWGRKFLARGESNRYQVQIPPRWLNSIMGGVTRCEESVARATGIWPPLGSTLLAVATNSK